MDTYEGLPVDITGHSLDGAPAMVAPRFRRMKITHVPIRAAVGRHFWWISPLASATVYFLFGHVLPYVPFSSVDKTVGPLYPDLLHGMKLSAPYVATILLVPLPAGFLVRWRRLRSAGKAEQAGDAGDAGASPDA